MDFDDAHIGAQVKRIRRQRGLTQKALAGLAGMGRSTVAMIETGDRSVTRRSVLEALAAALRVSPSDLTGRPWERPSGQAEAQASLADLGAALDAHALGEDPGVPVRDWPQIKADVDRSETWLHVDAEYAGLAGLLPGLLGELHAVYVRRPDLRRDVLLGLLQAYKQAVAVTKNLGGGGSNGLSLVAAMAAQRCADELASPQWRAIATWYRGFASGSLNRNRQYQRAVGMCDELIPVLDDPEVAQACGMLHLSAAMAAAAQSDRDTARTHLDEAAAIADRLDLEVGSFAMLWFGPTNVGIWRASIGLELGDGAMVAQAARTVHVDAIPSPKRQSDFWIDLGRWLVTDRRSRERGLRHFLRAEALAPQRARTNVFVHEAVAGLLHRAHVDAIGPELRGLAYRVGVAPIE